MIVGEGGDAETRDAEGGDGEEIEGEGGDGGNDEGEPFMVSYAIRAFPAPSEIVNNLDSSSAFNASSTEIESTAEDEEGEEEQG